MVKANELRIGNIVTFGIMQSRDTVTDIRFERSDGYLVNHQVPIISVKPIPLTPEVLLRCGYKLYDNDWFEITGKIRLSIELNTGRICFGKGEYFINSDIKYLHQLQNLYFILTGEELIYIA